MLVEENLKLQRDEDELMSKVKTKQRKKGQDLAGAKNLYNVHENANAQNRAGRNEMEQSRMLQQLRTEVTKTQKIIVQKKADLEATRRLADFDSSYEDLM